MTLKTHLVDWNRILAVAVTIAAAMCIGFLYDPASCYTWTHGPLLLVGQSLANDASFSGIVNPGSGPTGWCAPVIPAIVSILLLVSNGDVATVWVFLFAIKYVILATSFGVLAFRYSLWVSLPLVLLLLLRDLFWNLQHVYAEMLGGIFITMVLCRPACLFGEHKFWWCLRRALFVASACYVSPNIGLTVFASMTMGDFWTGHRRWLQIAMTTLLLTGLLVLPWAIRNKISVGGWSFIKTNSSFELYQSQVLDDDGVLDSSTLRLHPFVQGTKLSSAYVELGEHDFMTHYGGIAHESIRRDPIQYVERCSRRLVASLFGSEVFLDGEDRPRFWLLIIFVRSIPVLALLTCLIAPIPWHDIQKTALLIWVVFLTPYILISFHERYQSTLYPVYFVFLASACHWIASRARSKVNGLFD
jgi:hypothetical protein